LFHAWNTPFAFVACRANQPFHIVVVSCAFSALRFPQTRSGISRIKKTKWNGTKKISSAQQVALHLDVADKSHRHFLRHHC
jgi:hypothetical protein